MKSFFLLVILILSLAVASRSTEQAARNAHARSSHTDRTITSIRAVLDAQREAWNRGDIEGYMDGYDRSPDTEFVGGDTITRGWQTVLERYQKKYDSREKMGTLTFSDIEINVLSKDAASVLGRWSLQRASDRPHGTFTLIFRKTKQGWRIVHDHSSSA
jgi:ketosteroid isomerase-like protein